METTAQAPSRTPMGQVVGLCLGLALIVGTVTLAFAWPSSNMGANEIPIAVVGPPEAAAQVAERLDAAEPDGFDVTEAAGADRAREMIEEREVYAAFEIAPDGVNLYTASAASPAVARLVTGVAEQMAAGMGQNAGEPVPVDVEDVVAMPEDDPNGAGLASSALPLAAGGLIVAALLGLNVRGSGRQVLGAVLAPPAVAVAVAAILIYWLGAIDGDFWLIGGAIALTLYGAAWTVLGLTKLLGRAGLAIGAILIMLVGNPLSGMTSAPEMLPAPWGEFGQFLPPGAGGTLLRSMAFFDGNGAATAAVVLGAWTGIGMVLFALGAVRNRAMAVRSDQDEPAAAAV